MKVALQKLNCSFIRRITTSKITYSSLSFLISSSLVCLAIMDAAATTGIFESALCIEITSVSFSLVKLAFISHTKSFFVYISSIYVCYIWIQFTNYFFKSFPIRQVELVFHPIFVNFFGLDNFDFIAIILFNQIENFFNLL